MFGMLYAERAIFLKFKLFARILFVLHRIVVSLLAFLASERDFYSCVCSHSYGTSCIILLFGFQASLKANKKRLTPETGCRASAAQARVIRAVKTIAASPEACLPETAGKPIRTGRIKIAQDRKNVNLFLAENRGEDYNS